MAETEDDRGGCDLDGKPAVRATDMRIGVCKGGGLIGIDMKLKDGTVVHGHFDANSAMGYYQEFFAAIAEVLLSYDPTKTLLEEEPELPGEKPLRSVH